MDRFVLNNFGPIDTASVDFGDLTVLVGPQASGKSLFLEMFKYIIDKGQIQSALKSYNYILDDPETRAGLFDVYFGEGMSGTLKKGVTALFGGKEYNAEELLSLSPSKEEEVFYIPAQRIFSISDGRPKNFMEFDISTPYVLRSFSETLRLFLQEGLDSPENIFPLSLGLSEVVKDSFNASIFHNGTVVMKNVSGQRKMRMLIDGMTIPFMSWSAGQKEFMPLLIAFYCLSGQHRKVASRGNYKYVVIEEPEMGLHPQAIQSVILEILQLMSAGYKVVLSTHSTTILEFVWAFNTLSGTSLDDRVAAMQEIFDTASNPQLSELYKSAASKQIKTFYFAREENKVRTYDITDLNPSSEEEKESLWGGLSQFSTKVADVVYKYV